MAWSNSKIFRPMLADVLGNTCAMDYDADSFKAAWYGNTGTPDQNATSANSAYAVSAWVTGNEVSQVTQSPAGGIALTSQSLNSATSAVVFFDAADTATGSAATLSGIFGALVYDDTLTTPVADQGCSFNYFGGSQSVTAGQFTAVWHANGIFRFTL
jgi:hypothetical protein